jgi:3',5'-cyclic-AMP phosphodiesterase
MNKRRFFKSILGAATVLLLALQGCGTSFQETPGQDYHHLVVLGDPHLPGQHLVEKERAIEKINTWEDVALVVAVGDICAEYGTEAEYAAARAFFDKLHKPLFPVAGNHDYIHETPSGSGGGYKLGSQASQQAKLKLFRETFGLSTLFYSKQVGGYLLLFLSTDHDSFITGMSATQLDWLHTQLARHRSTPTIIFFHGPLNGTQYKFRHYINRPNAIAQPAETIHTLITANPQIFLWVSGHTHTPPSEESYASPINVYAGQVTNIHNTDMKRETIWTNSLFLYPDKVVVRTFNHREGAWQPELERTIPLPLL